jgi:hypothetical protein
MDWLNELSLPSNHPLSTEKAKLLILFLLFGKRRNMDETISEQMLSKFIRRRGLELLRAGAMEKTCLALRAIVLHISQIRLFEEMEKEELLSVIEVMKHLEVLLNLAFVLISVALVEKPLLPNIHTEIGKLDVSINISIN